MIRSVAMFGLLASFTMCAPLWAKGDMVLIEITGADLKAPLKITDPKIQEFNIWAGPGASAGGVEDTEGFIINWRAGVVQQLPAGLQHYRVSFYAGCNTRPNDPDCLAESRGASTRCPMITMFRLNRALSIYRTLMNQGGTPTPMRSTAGILRATGSRQRNHGSGL